MLRIAVFASGNGSNAENIIKYFKSSSIARVVLILSNNKNAKVLDRAKKLAINTFYFDRDDLYKTDKLVELLIKEIDFIVLAGFLWKIPTNMIQAFPNKIVNIHPALLPKYGGKGMYGMRVQQAVKENSEKETGITIHYVNENYDEGSIIFQKVVSLDKSDLPEQIAQKVQEIEYAYFPKIINDILYRMAKNSL